jgi:predicted secreted protein
MVDELKILKRLYSDKISVEHALDVMQQTVDITDDGIDSLKLLSQAVHKMMLFIAKAR